MRWEMYMGWVGVKVVVGLDGWNKECQDLVPCMAGGCGSSAWTVKVHIMKMGKACRKQQ